MGTWIAGAMVAIIAGLAVRSIIKDKKGRGCGNCKGCSKDCGKQR